MKIILSLLFVLLLSGCASPCNTTECYKAKAELERQQHEHAIKLQEHQSRLEVERLKAQKELFNSTWYIESKKIEMAHELERQRIETANEQASDIDYLSDSQRIRDGLAVGWALLQLLK